MTQFAERVGCNGRLAEVFRAKDSSRCPAWTDAFGGTAPQHHRDRAGARRTLSPGQEDCSRCCCLARHGRHSAGPSCRRGANGPYSSGLTKPRTPIAGCATSRESFRWPTDACCLPRRRFCRPRTFAAKHAYELDPGQELLGLSATNRGFMVQGNVFETTGADSNVLNKSMPQGSSPAKPLGIMLSALDGPAFHRGTDRPLKSVRAERTRSARSLFRASRKPVIGKSVMISGLGISGVFEVVGAFLGNEGSKELPDCCANSFDCSRRIYVAGVWLGEDPVRSGSGRVSISAGRTA